MGLLGLWQRQGRGHRDGHPAAASDLQPLDAFRVRGQVAGVHTEVVTSRDELLLVPAKLVESGRQKTLKLDVCWLARIAPQSWIGSKLSSALCAGTPP